MKKIKHLEKFQVKTYGKQALQTVAPETSIDECQRLLKKEGIHHLPVERDKKIVGIISSRDISMISNQSLAEKICAEDLMKTETLQVDEKADLASVTALMLEHKVGSVLLKNEQHQITGIFTTTDALLALHDVMGEEISKDKLSITFY